MKTFAKLLASLTLLGCQAERDVERAADTPAPVARAPLPDDKFMVVRDDEHSYSEKTIFHNFTYVWPLGVRKIAALQDLFQAEMERLRADTRARGRQAYIDRGGRHGESLGFNKIWQNVGMNARLISLIGHTGYTPQSYEALLWDRALNRRISFEGLFADPSTFFAYIQPRMCRTLNLVRARRDEPAPPPDIRPERAGPKPLNLPCPAADRLVIAPKDSSGDGAFDTIAFKIKPGSAGGADQERYELDLPVDAQVIGLLRPEYRPSFEVYQQ